MRPSAPRRPVSNRAVFPILFQDSRFVVIDKPPGLPVHAGPRGGPSVEDVFPTLSRRKDGPWLAHRLDADTAGCLVIALRRAALHAAQAAFAAGRVRKTYWAVVEGAPAAESGVVDAPLLKRTKATGWRMVVDPAGQPAVTEWHVLGRAEGRAWLELHPRTGRTHQIRVHCAVLGCPILGDPVYGAGEGPLQLLARAIALPLDPAVAATAPPPPHMRTALVACGLERR
jgi:tRNA pseudouridine32 synthase / 23S rRNA pseudouridine746 synthase